MEIGSDNPFLIGKALSDRNVLDDTKLQLLKAFFDHAPMLMGVVEYSDGEVLHRAANRPAVQLFRAAGGGKIDDEDGVEMTDLGFTPSETAMWGRHIAASAKSGQPVHFETTFPWGSRSGDPDVRELEVVVVPAGPSRSLFAYVSQDVTDLRRGDRERKLLAAAVEQAAESIIVTGPELDPPGPQILYVNAAHERLFGYTREQVTGQTPRLFQGPQTDRTVLARIRRALEAGEPVEAEAVNYRKDGTELNLKWEIAPVRDETGDIVNWVGTQRDVTEQRRLEREVLEVAAHEQSRMAQELHDGLGAALSGVSFMAEALRRRVEERGDVDLTGQLERLIERLSSAQRQARAVAHALFPVDFLEGGLMQALETLCSEAHDAYGVDCTFTADEAFVMRSPESAGHLYRIVQEALANAGRHSRASAVTITLTDSEGGKLLSVQDNGIGIPDAALSEAGGMGLRTMRRRAEHLGGTLRIQSVAGNGTAVVVRFDPDYVQTVPV